MGVGKVGLNPVIIIVKGGISREGASNHNRRDKRGKGWRKDRTK